MTADEFRANKELVIGLRTVLENETLKLAMKVLGDDLNPVSAVPSPSVTPHFAHIQLGQQTGWAQYPKMLRLLASHPETRQELPEPDYSDPLVPTPEEQP